MNFKEENMNDKLIAVALALACVVSPAYAWENKPVPSDIAGQVAGAWEIIASAKGDLNKDKLDDYAVIIEKNDVSEQKLKRFYITNDAPYINSSAEDIWESTSQPRKVVVFFAQKNGQFEPVLMHSDWVERSDMGGVLGDSFDGLEIHNGSFLLKGFGGSRDKWLRTIRIRYQEDKWRMIGYTERQVNGRTLKVETYDMNLLSYKINIKKEDQDVETDNYWDVIADKTKIYIRNEVK